VEVRRLLATLPRRWQEIVRLRYMDEMSAPEVAAHLGLNPDHVRQISRRALLALRARLNSRNLSPTTIHCSTEGFSRSVEDSTSRA
jgi:DNA-directed RNA polymerase specialized sigma24 family protein